MKNAFEIRPCPECGKPSFFNGRCWECSQCKYKFDRIVEEVDVDVDDDFDDTDDAETDIGGEG